MRSGVRSHQNDGPKLLKAIIAEQWNMLRRAWRGKVDRVSDNTANVLVVTRLRYQMEGTNTVIQTLRGTVPGSNILCIAVRTVTGRTRDGSQIRQFFFSPPISYEGDFLYLYALGPTIINTSMSIPEHKVSSTMLRAGRANSVSHGSHWGSVWIPGEPLILG